MWWWGRAASGREEIKKGEKVGKRYCGGSESRREEIKKREKVGNGDCGGQNVGEKR
jgi:hypothetical protein